MTDPWRACCTLAAALAVFVPHVLGAQTQQTEPKKPTLAVRVTPPMGFTPLRVRAIAEARNGDNDYADFYCATVEWDWGDGTISENTSDCNPYEAGKSEIQRRFTSEHIYRQGGPYRVTFRLKQKTKAVGGATATVQVRTGAGDPFGR